MKPQRRKDIKCHPERIYAVARHSFTDNYKDPCGMTIMKNINSVSPGFKWSIYDR
jgi:hypothetical protein